MGSIRIQEIMCFTFLVSFVTKCEASFVQVHRSNCSLFFQKPDVFASSNFNPSHRRRGIHRQTSDSKSAAEGMTSSPKATLSAKAVDLRGESSIDLGIGS